MKNFYLLFVIAALSGCTRKLSANWTKDGYTERSFSKIAVVGVSKNLSARIKFEKVAVERFKKNGINAIEGIEIFPPKMTEAQKKPENLIQMIKKNKVDGVITMSLIDSDEGKRYRQGEDYVYPAGYYRFGRYYVQRYERIHTPGYYVSTKSYLIEAVLYDLKGELFEGKETLVWSGQSSLVDPSSLESAAKSFTKTMVEHMVKEGVVKGK